MKNFFLNLILFLSIYQLSAQESVDSADTTGMSQLISILNFEENIPFQRGSVDLSEKIKLNIPSGYKFIPKKESERIVFDIWGNPERPGISGMLVLENFSILDQESWAFVMSEENEGYVEDEDASDIDYNDLLQGKRI